MHSTVRQGGDILATDFLNYLGSPAYSRLDDDSLGISEKYKRERLIWEQKSTQLSN